MVAGYTILRLIPPSLLQLVIGTLLLIFGMQWLRKAILRSAGRKALHDEDAIYATEIEAAQAAPGGRCSASTGSPSSSSFKGVLLEGLEVVVHRAHLRHQRRQHPARGGRRVLAIVPVTILVIVVRAAAVARPREQLKYVVGLLLTTFGTFWAIEGLGLFASGSESLEWPVGDLAICSILLGWVVVSRAADRVLRERATGDRRGGSDELRPPRSSASGTSSSSATTGGSRRASSGVLAIGALAVSAGYAEPALPSRCSPGWSPCSRSRSWRIAGGPRRARPTHPRARPAARGTHRRRRSARRRRSGDDPTGRASRRSSGRPRGRRRCRRRRPRPRS